MSDDLVLMEMRKTCLKLANRAGDANLQSVFSCFEIMWCLYDRILDLSRIKDGENDRDFFLCSKGQANLGLQVILAEKGFINREELLSYGGFDSRVSMQADRTKFESGVEISAGSLGHGLPMGAGIALSKKINKYEGEVYVLIGDGELHEGSCLEALSFIGSRMLSNICVIIDDNGSHSYMFGNDGIVQRINSYGFKCIECEGHSINSLYEAFLLSKSAGKPSAIIARTQRGYGSKTLMTKKSWFHRAPSDDELPELLHEVDSFDTKEARGYILTED